MLGCSCLGGSSFSEIAAHGCLVWRLLAAGLLAAEPVGALLGLPAQVVAIGGWICLAAALLMIVAARQAVPATALVKLIALGNLGWVAASFAVIAAFAAQMTGLGIAAVAAMGDPRDVGV